MPAQRTRSSVPADHRSAHPDIPGVPWWGAVLIAVIGTTIGFAFSAGSADKELGGMFAAMYALGCLAAVLAVRHSAIFTAVIQPPLILFVAVPGAYFLFHGAELSGMKDTLINYGYPLIERFPLMLFTSAAVLLIGMVRWYYALWSSTRPQAEAENAEPGRFSALAGKVATLFGGAGPGEEPAEEKPKRRHGIDRPPVSEKRPRPDRSTTRSTGTTRSRHARPPVDEAPRRRPRPPRESDGRTPPPPRREPPSRRESYGPRPGRYEPYEPYEPYQPPPRRRPRPDEFDRRGESSTHHPVSRVRYRDSEGLRDSPGSRDPEPLRDSGRYGADGRGESRSRHRRVSDWDADARRYDR